MKIIDDLDEKEISEIFDYLFSDWETLLKKKVELWEITSIKISELIHYLEQELQYWTGSKKSRFRANKSLYWLKVTNNRFINSFEQIERYKQQKIELFDRNQNFFDDYRKQLIPIIRQFTRQLDKTNKFRVIFEKKMEAYQQLAAV